jgi:arylsulfatase A-like enzyme
MVKKPNVLLFHTHDTGRFIGPYGVDTVRTPHLERVAAEGVVFERAYCSAPQCSPSRASLFTGRYPHSNGVVGLTHTAEVDLGPEEIHASTHFARLGYETARFGICHETRQPKALGYHWHWPENAARKAAENFVGFLEGRGNATAPWFASVGSFETHRPFDFDGCTPEDALGITVPNGLNAEGEATRADAAALQGSVERVDEALGRILEALEAQGALDDTLVLVTTDHGLPVPRAKCNLYEAGTGIFMMMRCPRALPMGRREGGRIANIDVLPTLLDAVGAPADLPGRERIEGRSHWDALCAGRGTERDMAFLEQTHQFYYDPARGAVDGRWRYMRNFLWGPGVHVPGDIRATDLFVENLDTAHTPRGHPEEELYDLSADPTERANLARDAAYEPILARMRSAVAAEMRRTNDPLLEGPIDCGRFQRLIAEMR